jgi:hypothetical protein
MMSFEANNETIHNNGNIQPGTAYSQSPSVQYEIVARHQQYESIVATGYEQLTAQYEAVHNNTLEHIDEVVSQVNRLENQLDRWVNTIDDDGYWQILDEEATQVHQLEGQPPAGRCENNVDVGGYLPAFNDEGNPAILQ